MKNLVFLFFNLLIIIVATQRVSAQNPEATANATASANIIKVISITNDQNLLFGNIIASAAGGTITVSSDGTSSATYSGITAPTGNEGSRQAAIFTVEGELSATYSITLPSDNVIELTMTGGDPMELVGFSHNASGTLSNDTGKEIFNVGATLNVNANQATGTYTGSFPVTVAYN
ncbi:DUF4402 domain-containing protein [uncultured Sunxiuqinia sp.]|uniref:DUF4402 domain-containing protein n=1 Tax=uncultured Sunxiuqinia sp. TaxID=1573825 RepID=UPI002AA70CA8|nr:DUF4402 domain-containing protein [uncultured Sunxiuqinia sp.]